MSSARTPSQTIGPFFGFALPWPGGHRIVAPETAGAIELRGRMLDGQGVPIIDGLVETWQADPEGRFCHGARPFRGFARCPTDGQGSYRIVTLKPGPVASGGIVHAPHIAMSIFARGLLNRLSTRIYFSDEAERNAADPVLSSIAEPEARATLVAARVAGGYLFDIRLQGEGETVFFDG